MNATRQAATLPKIKKIAAIDGSNLYCFSSPNQEKPTIYFYMYPKTGKRKVVKPEIKSAKLLPSQEFAWAQREWVDKNGKQVKAEELKPTPENIKEMVMVTKLANELAKDPTYGFTAEDFKAHEDIFNGKLNELMKLTAQH